jgi:hypothetical protein
VTRRFVKILKEGAGDYVLHYENTFFRAGDLRYLSPSEAAIVKAHLFSSLEKEQSEALLDLLDGFGAFPAEGEVGRVVTAYVKILL